MIHPSQLQWITYDGTPETHPCSGDILVYNHDIKHYDFASFYAIQTPEGQIRYQSIDTELVSGDIWTYILE